MTRFLQLFALFAIFFAETANASCSQMSSVVPCCSVTDAKIRPDFAFRGMARVEDDFLLAPDGSLFHPKLGLPLNGLRSSNQGLEINKQAIEGLEAKTYMIIASPLIYLMPVAIGAGIGGRNAWTSVGNYIATGESDYGGGDAALALIGMVPFGAWSSTPNFAAAAAKAGAIGSKGLAGAREALNASRLAKAINCGPVARGLARNGWITARCFPGDTLASGKRMDQYHKDELLTAWDDAKTTFVQARITQIFVHEHDGEFAEVTLTSGASLKPTAEHPFRLAQPEQLGTRPAVVFDAPQEGTWVEARYLRTGDLLLTPKGAIAVASVRVYHDKIKVYNFEVEGLHNYTVGADGVVVHNACAHTAAYNAKQAAYAKYVQRNGKNALGIQAWAQGVSRPAGSLGYTAGMARHSQNLAARRRALSLEDHHLINQAQLTGVRPHQMALIAKNEGIDIRTAAWNLQTMPHRGGHTTAYYRHVRNYLDSVYSRYSNQGAAWIEFELKSVAQQISKDIASGAVKLYK